jgi:hypothetical protein
LFCVDEWSSAENFAVQARHVHTAEMEHIVGYIPQLVPQECAWLSFSSWLKCPLFVHLTPATIATQSILFEAALPQQACHLLLFHNPLCSISRTPKKPHMAASEHLTLGWLHLMHML